jgi:hypothetical protein
LAHPLGNEGAQNDSIRRKQDSVVSLAFVRSFDQDWLKSFREAYIFYYWILDLSVNGAFDMCFCIYRSGYIFDVTCYFPISITYCKQESNMFKGPQGANPYDL